MDLSSLPDEILLKILAFFTDEPEVLINILGQVSKRFHSLSQDASLWRQFMLPDHWPSKIVHSFLRFDQVTTHIQELQCPHYALFALPHFSKHRTFPGIRRLLLSEGSEVRWKLLGFGPPPDVDDSSSLSAVDLIVDMFPNLEYLLIPLDFISKEGKLDRLKAACSELRRVEVVAVPNGRSDHGWNTEMHLLCSSDVIKNVVFNMGECPIDRTLLDVDPGHLGSIQLALDRRRVDRSTNRLDEVTQTFVLKFGLGIESLAITNLPYRELVLIAQSCQYLQELHIKCVEEEGTDLTTLPQMPTLKRLCLEDVSAQMIPRILATTPFLEKLSLRDLSENLSGCSVTLPTTLKSLAISRCSSRLSRQVLELSSHCSRLEELVGVTTGTFVESLAAYTKTDPESPLWKQFKRIALEGSREGSDSDSDIALVVKCLSHHKAPLRSIKIWDLASDIVFDSIIGCLSALPTVRSLTLHKTKGVTLKHLEDILSVCPELESLDLKYNCAIGSSSAESFFLSSCQAIAEVLQLFRFLKKFLLFLNLEYMDHWTNSTFSEIQDNLNHKYAPWQRVTVTSDLFEMIRIPLANRT